MERFAAALDLKFAFKNVERFVLTVVDVSRRSVMWRDDSLREGVPTFSVSTRGFIGEIDSLEVQPQAFTGAENFGTALF